MWTQILFAQPQVGWRHLKQFIFIDIGHHFFERHPHRRHQFDSIIASRRPHIGQLLAFEHINLKVVAPAMFTNDHALIDSCLRPHKHLPAILQVKQRIGHSHAGISRYQGAIAAAFDRPFMRPK